MTIGFRAICRKRRNTARLHRCVNSSTSVGSVARRKASGGVAGAKWRTTAARNISDWTGRCTSWSAVRFTSCRRRPWHRSKCQRCTPAGSRKARDFINNHRSHWLVLEDKEGKRRRHTVQEREGSTLVVLLLWLKQLLVAYVQKFCQQTEYTPPIPVR